MTKTFDELPLVECTLSIEERARWINVIDPLLKFANSPGDWGYQSKLGVLTQKLYQVRAEIVKDPAQGYRGAMMNLNELPEQLTTPPEPSSGLQLVCDAIRHDTYVEQSRALARRAEEVLNTRMGTVRTVNRGGHYIELDAGDLYDDLTANEESADLSILMSAAVPNASFEVRRRAGDYRDLLIRRFAEEYAVYMADKAVDVYLVGLGEAA